MLLFLSVCNAGNPAIYRKHVALLAPFSVGFRSLLKLALGEEGVGERESESQEFLPSDPSSDVLFLWLSASHLATLPQFPYL